MNGAERQIIIDDNFPLLKGNKLVNAGPSVGQGWWLPLLEKAYAKVNVNYENLDHGDATSQL